MTRRPGSGRLDATAVPVTGGARAAGDAGARTVVTGSVPDRDQDVVGGLA